MRIRIFFLALLTSVGPSSALAADAEDPNYTTQNVMILNEEGQILMQRNFMGWSTPGTRYDKRLTIEESLADLAGQYGVQLCDIRLAGLFSYRYSYTPAISTRSHYFARSAGGSARPPKGFDELRWVDRDKVIGLMASDTQKAPPALVELTRKMIQEPGQIWGGAFSIWQEGDLYRSRMVQPFYALGYTAPSISAAIASGAPGHSSVGESDTACVRPVTPDQT